MDNKMLNMSEAFIKMTESFLRLLRAVKGAKLAIDNVLRQQYKEAGSPFGEGEEGLLLWREKLSKDYALLRESAAHPESAEKPSVNDKKEILYFSEHFNSLQDEANSRIN